MMFYIIRPVSRIFSPALQGRASTVLGNTPYFNVIISQGWLYSHIALLCMRAGDTIKKIQKLLPLIQRRRDVPLPISHLFYISPGIMLVYVEEADFF